ncbi:MAG: LacI family transcriptional regulator [Glaciihabitans sp.]|jgi:LacI family transcriptional regulator|nr:LacI family transcriptional regulator [Glaciihabitans sp.]
MPKINDVALAAGVSTATVSRVLNNSKTVNAELADRVRVAAHQLGYRPNGIARSLRRRSSDVIALIINDVSNPFFTAITRGVEDVAQRSGYSVLLCNTDEDPGKEATYLRVAEQQQVAGVILSPNTATSDVSRLFNAQVPLVVIDRTLNEPVDSVMVHSLNGAEAATQHLLASGWKRPACVAGPREASTASDRLHGFLEAVRQHGNLEELYEYAPFTQEGGANAAKALLDLPTPPDSLFVANSQMALGVLDEVRRRGLRIGYDIGIITFDDAPWAPFISPPMSVVAQPAYEVGRRAAELLMERVISGTPLEPREVTLSTTLILRESSKRLPA